MRRHRTPLLSLLSCAAALGLGSCGESASPAGNAAAGVGGSTATTAGAPSGGAAAQGGQVTGAGTGAGTRSDSAGAGGAGDPEPSGGAGGSDDAPRRAPFDWVGVVGTGQSLSVGVTAGYISLQQPYGNLTLLDSGPTPRYPVSGGTPQWSAVPLIEPLRAKVTGYTDNQYPNNLAGETPHSGMANTLSWLWQQRGDAGEYVSVHSAVGWSGKCLVDIDKAGGQRAYPASLSEARAFKALAVQQGKTFGYGGIIVTHGECDSTTPNYAAGLYQLLQDYDADLKAITGQTENVVMLVSQQSTKATGKDGSAAQVWRAGLEHPGEIICTGPKYQYQYAPDKLHLQAAGYRRLGEKYAQVFDRVVNQKQAWQPLGPTAAVRSGNVVKVTFHVPVPPLVWSQHLAPPHQSVNTEWAKGRGFEVVTVADQVVAIQSAEIEGDSVLLTLASPPAAALVVRYAMTQDGTLNQGGDVLGLRGLLRDSDPFVGADGETIDVVLTQGSNLIQSATKGAFRRRTGFDVLSEAGTPLELVVKTRDSDDQLTLSGPWPGASGTRSLSFRYDLYNYAVHFSMPVASAP